MSGKKCQETVTVLQANIQNVGFHDQLAMAVKQAVLGVPLSKPLFVLLLRTKGPG